MAQQTSARIVEHTVYLFDGFQLDVTRRKLCSTGGVVQPLSSRAMDALLMLVAHAGEVIDKRRLMQAVWPTAVVEDNNLNQCILAIRRALGETAGSNRFIMTVPGRGYCFVSPVSTLTHESTVGGAPAARVWPTAAWIAAGAMAGIASLLLWTAARRDTARDLTDQAGLRAEEIMLRLHPQTALITAPNGTGTIAAALPDCLVQRPDLHLQVEVRLVGADGLTALWTGQYMAGSDDIAAGQHRSGTAADACRGLFALD